MLTFATIILCLHSWRRGNKKSFLLVGLLNYFERADQSRAQFQFNFVVIMNVRLVSVGIVAIVTAINRVCNCDIIVQNCM